MLKSLTSLCMLSWIQCILVSANSISNRMIGCRSDENCPLKCAYCNEKSQCEIIDDEVFYNKSTEICEWRTDHCKVTECKSAGCECKENYGKCVCSCSKDYWGDSCQFKQPLKNPFLPYFSYPYGFNLVTPLRVYMSTCYTSLILLLNLNIMAPMVLNDTYGSIFMRFSDLLGDARFKLKHLNIGGVYKVDDCLWSFRDDRYFDPKELCFKVIHFDKKHEMFAFQVWVPRFVVPFDVFEPSQKLREFQLTVYKPGTASLRLDSPHLYVFKRKFVVASIEDNLLRMLTPIVRVSNCGNTIDNIKIFGYMDVRTFTASIYFKDYFSNELLKSPISADRRIIDGWFDYDWEDFEVSGEIFLHKERHKAYFVYHGSYPTKYVGGAASVHANEIVRINNLTVRYHSMNRIYSNYNLCYYMVKFAPLEARIAGGSVISTYSDNSLQLDFSQSQNPNCEPGFRKQDVIMIIHCNWTEENICFKRTLDSIITKTFTIKPNTLHTGRTYLFTLKVISKNHTWNERLKPAYASQMVIVNDRFEPTEAPDEPTDAPDEPTDRPYTPHTPNRPIMENLTIECVYNCEDRSNYQDIICLRVRGLWQQLENLEFEWGSFVFYGNKLSKNSSLDDYRQKDTLPFLLVLKENSLTPNFKYNFGVSYLTLFSMYSIHTTEKYSSNCHVRTLEGFKSTMTSVQINCIFKSPQRVFEFYDKYETDGDGFTGRMIARQNTDTVRQVALTRGKVQVVAYDEYGTRSTYSKSVPIRDQNYTIDHITGMISELSRHYDKGFVQPWEFLQTVGYIVDCFVIASVKINSSSDESVDMMKFDMYDDIMRLLSSLSIDQYGDAKMGLSTLRVLLVAARGSLTLESAVYSARTILTVAKTLRSGITNEGNTEPFEVLSQELSSVLDCIYIVLETVKIYFDKGELTGLYGFVNPRAKEITRYLMRSSFIIKSLLSRRQIPGQNEIVIQSSLGNLTLWSKITIPNVLSKYTKKLNEENILPVMIPDKLASTVTKMGFYLGLQCITFNNDPTYRIINTENTFDVSVCYKENNGKVCNYPKFLKHGVHVSIDISNAVSQVEFRNFSLKRLDPMAKPEVLERELPVYKFDPPSTAHVDSQFKFYSNTTAILLSVERNKRPTYVSLLSKHHKVNHKRAVYPVVEDPSGKPGFYYMALQPDQVKVNQSVYVGIKLFSIECKNWHGHWSSRGCQRVAKRNSDILVCECKMLSPIGGIVKEVVLYSGAVQDFPLSLTLGGVNKTILLWLTLLLLSFLFLVIVCAIADNKDKSRRIVSVLPDNLPGDKYGYLVCVVTGARLGAGTTAAVGIRLYGTLNDGRRHILSSNKHDVMEGMGEDWFLLFESAHSGKLCYLDLWHDCAGGRQGWFCDSIIVYDLHHRDCYYFIVNDWISLSVNSFPETCVYPTPLSQVVGPPRVFMNSFRSGFHLSHIWFDVICRHPRDPVSRIDRLAIIFSFILVSAAVGLLIIHLIDGDTEIDDYHYSVTLSMVFISVISCIPAAFVVFILMRLFRNIYKIIFYIEKKEDKKTHEKRVTRVSLQEDFLRTPSVVSLKDDVTRLHYGKRHTVSHERKRRKNLAEQIPLALMAKPLVPVQAEKDDPNVEIDKNWLITSWILIAAICIISVIIIIILSKNIPSIKTLKFLTIITMTILLHALILLPLKIIVTSSLLALAFQPVTYKDVYTFDPNDCRRVEYFGNKRFLSNFVYIRSKPMYKPLHEVFREKHRQDMRRAWRWRKFCDFLVQILFLVVLWSVLDADIRTKSHTNNNLLKFKEEFPKIFNITHLERFEHSCEHYVFNYIWYNWETLSNKIERSFYRGDWMFDSVSRMMGEVRMRQFRVKPGYCTSALNLTVDCAPPFSRRAQDTRDFYPFWVNPKNSSSEDNSSGVEYLSEWRYQWPSQDLNFQVEGKTGQTYPGGGYTMDLGASEDDMDTTLLRVFSEWWVDHYTRAVLTQVKVYNVNTGLFSEISLVLEQTIAGQVIAAVVVQSVDVNTEFNFWLCMFIFFAIMTCARILILANYFGVMSLFNHWRRLFELIIGLTTLAVLPYFLLHNFTVPAYISNYQVLAHEFTYFDFYKIAHFLFTAWNILCLLYVLSIIRFLSLWRFGKTIYRCFVAFVFTMNSIPVLVTVFVLFQYILFRSIGYILSIFIDRVFNPSMTYKFMYSNVSFKRDINETNILCYVISFGCLVMNVLYVTIISHHYKTAWYEVLRHWNVYNYITFVKQEIFDVLRKPIVRRTTRRLSKWYADHKIPQEKKTLINS